MLAGRDVQVGTDPSREPEPVNLEAVAATLSPERLTKYMARTGHNVAKALELYIWNQEIGAALTVTLSQFEVCLRNQIAKVLVNAYGEAWHTKARLRYHNQDTTTEFEKAHERGRKARNGFDPAAGDFIAGSDFNLWRELCKPLYAGVFWGKRVQLAFPHAPAGKERDTLVQVHRRVDLLLKLRNRIAHHEPIIGSNLEPIGEKLRDRHRDMAELLGWMDPNFAHWMAARNRFNEVMSACPVRGPDGA
jgi:hypothetical protein